MQSAEDDPNPFSGTQAFASRTPVRYATIPTSARPSRVALLAAVFGLGLILYLAVEPTKDWLLLVVTAIAGIGADGILREHPHGDRELDFAWTAPLLYLPTLFALASGLFLEDVLSGYWVIPGAIIAAGLMAMIVYAGYASIDELSAAYPGARFILNVGTYLTAFGFFAVVYTFDIALVPAATAVVLVSLLLAVEILREAEADPMRALVFAGVVGLIVAEARVTLYFLPLESYLAAVFLLLVFYLVSGLVQHHLNDDLDRPVISEFSAIALIGVLIVTLGRVFESGA